MKRYLFALFLIAPLSIIASNGDSATGIPDSILLVLLAAIIIMQLVIIKSLAKSIEFIAKTPTPKKKKTKIEKASLILLLFGSSFSAQAAEVSSTSASFVMNDVTFWSLVGVIVFLGITIGVLFRSLMVLAKLKSGADFEEENASSVFDVIKLTDNVPIEEESNVMMDHEYDGIRELDNNLPPWWKYMFYGTIIFAFVYIIRFHITGDGQLSLAEYQTEMNEAAEAKAEVMANAGEIITEENVTYLIDASSIEKGAAIYKGNCATCHGQLGEGGAGPNLTDEYWLHGGGIKEIFNTVKYGVPAKGMIAWQSQFNPTQIQEVSSYILSLKGTDPPNGKDPQGEIYVEEIISPESDSTATDTVAAAGEM